MTTRRHVFRFRGLLPFWPAVGACLVFACSSSDDPAAPPSEVPEGGAPGVDGAVPTDAGVDATRDADAAAPVLNYDFAVVCAGTPCVTRIAARGGSHACAILENGTLRCWGANESGQLGTGAVDAAPMPGFVATPRAVVGISGATAIAASGQGVTGATCVVSGVGDVSCFGSDAQGQLGRGTVPSKTPQPEPVVVAGLQAKEVMLANTFALAVSSDDRLWAWGANDAYQLARGPTDASPSPSTAPRPADRISKPVRSYGGTSTNGFVVTEEGGVLSWGGSSSHEQLGRSSSLAADPVPSSLTLAETTRIATGASHACALNRAGAVHCWGNNDHGQLGTGTRGSELLPTRVLLPDDVYAVAIAAGGDDTCIIASTGAFYCWGANGAGQAGADAGEDQPRPQKIQGLEEQVVSAAVMDDSICALLRGGSVHCWGDNLVGQLGRGTRDAELHLTPAPIVLE